MPHATGEVAASRSVSASRRTPALASAKIGRTPNEMYGRHAASTRSLIESESRRLRVTAAAYAGFGDSRNAWVSSVVRSTSPRRGGKTGMSRATATPARVGWMPDSSTAIHSAAPRPK